MYRNLFKTLEIRNKSRLEGYLFLERDYEPAGYFRQKAEADPYQVQPQFSQISNQMGDMNNHGNQTKNRPYGVGVQSPEKNVSSENHRYVQG